MSFIRIVFIASAAFAILPLLGIPTAGKTVVQFLLSLFLFVVTYREYRKIKGDTIWS